MEIKVKEIEVFGRKITIETGKMAKQADGAAVVTCEGTSVLATVVASDDARNIDFLPLTVDVEEKLYAAGKIPGSFFRREGRPTEGATLTARIIDRTLRPNFDKKFRNETQVVITVLSTDQVNPPDMLGMLGAATALSLSNVPFHGPLAGVRVASIGERWVINPTFKEIDESSINLVVAGNAEALLMVEAGASEVTEADIIAGLEAGHKAVKELLRVIEELDSEVRAETGQKPKKEIIDGILETLEPGYHEAISATIAAHRDGDDDSLQEAEAAYKQVLLDAQQRVPNEHRKIVGMLSRVVSANVMTKLLTAQIEPEISESMRKALIDASVPGLSKAERSLMRNDAKKGLAEPFAERFPGLEGVIKEIISTLERSYLRKQILETNMRPDGRKPFQIRKISCEVGLLPRTHGSGLFTRGETQVMTITTLGAYGEKQILDDLGTEEFKSFIHHYNFPAFATGEARPMRGPKRREIGHGALVERALQPLIPREEEFPYTIRLVSEVLESNGSSSMASVCAASMSLMDAGVPLKDESPISGIAMGLVLEGDRYVILSDIQGLEDAVGDMDFKVAGSKKGITALQMDIKCLGVSREIMGDALEQARQGRSFIIKAMSESIAEPRSEVSPNAPRMIQLEIPVDKIGDLIGPGGKNIRGLIERYEVDIDVENDGRVFVFGRDAANVEAVKAQINRITRDPEIGERFVGTVVKTTNFGAFVQLAPGKDGLVHISKLAKGRVERVEDVVNVGDRVEVEVENIDNLGRIDLRAINLHPDEG